MIKVTVGNNVKRESVIIDESTTLRACLEANGVDYTRGVIPLIRKKSAKSSLNCRMTSVAKSSMFLMRATTMGFYPERLTTYTSLLLSVGFLLCMILLP